MKKLCLVYVLVPLMLHGQVGELKQESIDYLDSLSQTMFSWSDSIWKYSEPSFKEFKSSQLLKAVLIKEGFKVEENISGCTTMFIASYGTGAPVIGILGEYDADVASNESSPLFPQTQSGFVHASGHNLLAVGSLGAALAIKKLLRAGKLKGTIRYYGSTAEGGLGGRIYMARDGYFGDLNLAVFWHPSPVLSSNLSAWDAIIDLKVQFKNPEGGASPLYMAAEFMQQLNILRTEHNDQLNLHYTVDSPTTDLALPVDSVQMQIRIEHPDQLQALAVLRKVKDRLSRIKGETRLTVFRAVHEFIPSEAANNLAQASMELLGPIPFNETHESMMSKVFSHLGKEARPLIRKPLPHQTVNNKKVYRGYGSDIGDVSWFAPEMSFVVTCLPLGISMSNWEGALFAGSDIGKEGMLYASKVITLSVIDYIIDVKKQDAILKEFKQRTRHASYQSLIPPGPPDLRMSTKRSR